MEIYRLRESKSEFLHNTILTSAKNIFLDTKNSPRKGIKSVFPKNFNEYISTKQANVLLNAMQLYDYRNKIIRLLEDKSIKPSKYYAYNAKSEPAKKKCDEAKKSEQEFDESK